MEEVLRQIQRELYINENVDNVDNIVDKYKEGEIVTINLKASNNSNNIVQNNEEQETNINKGNHIPVVGKTYIFKVKRYMTKPSTPQFNFQEKWNNNTPMPFRTMVGTVTKETRGMIYAECWAEPLETDTCIKCGRRLTHPVSKLYGLGPECGSHAYINPFESEEELNKHIDEVYENLIKIKWDGWIIKSAIELCQEVK